MTLPQPAVAGAVSSLGWCFSLQAAAPLSVPAARTGTYDTFRRCYMAQEGPRGRKTNKNNGRPNETRHCAALTGQPAIMDVACLLSPRLPVALAVFPNRWQSELLSTAAETDARAPSCSARPAPIGPRQVRCCDQSWPTDVRPRRPGLAAVAAACPLPNGSVPTPQRWMRGAAAQVLQRTRGVLRSR